MIENSNKQYPHPYVASDIVLLSMESDDIEVLLIQREKDPHKGKWALPGGFVQPGETFEQAGIRKLKEETSITVKSMTPLDIKDCPNRDPRGWVISHPFMKVVDKKHASAIAGDDAKVAWWFKAKLYKEFAGEFERTLSLVLESNEGITIFGLVRESTITDGIFERKILKAIHESDMAFDHVEIICNALLFFEAQMQLKIDEKMIEGDDLIVY